MIYMHFIYGLLGVILGFCMVKYRYWLYDVMGKWSFAEKLFGPGGTVTGIILLGFIIIIFSIVLMFGQLDNTLSGVSKYVSGGK